MANIADSLNVDDSLGKLLESTKYREFLQAVSYFHSYSLRNILLIFNQMPHATRVATFTAWKEQYKRTVIRGSTGIRILSPAPDNPKKTLVEKIDPDTGSPALDGAGKKIYEESFLPGSPKFEKISVFDITQTRGSPVMKLVDGIADNEALYGAFFDSLKFVFAPSVPEGTPQTLFQTVCNLVNASDLAENSTFPQVGERLAADSISYVVCRRFGIDAAGMSFDYLSGSAEGITPIFGEILDTVKNEASRIITALEDNFKRICEERGINPMTEYEPETPEPKPVKSLAEPILEPLYNVAPRIEETPLGVNFSHYDIIPVKPVFALAPPKSTEQAEPPQEPAKRIIAPQIIIPRKQIPPDPLVSIADREQYGYTRRQELLPLSKDRAIKLFNRNMSIYLLHSDNRESMVLELSEIAAHNGIFGVPHMEWYNSREYLALASGNPEAQREAAFVYGSQNAFAVYQIREGEADTHTEPYRYKPYSQLAQMGLMVDYNNYSLVYTGSLLPADNPEKLYMRFNMNKPQGYSGKSMGISDVLSINTDSVIASHYVDAGEYTELMSFIGVEKPRAKPGKERENFEKNHTRTADPHGTPTGGEAAEGEISEPPPQSAETLSELPPPNNNEPDEVLTNLMSMAEDFTDVEVYGHSYEQAKEHKQTEVYNFQLMINQQCAADIDAAIEASKVAEDEYRLAKAVNTVIQKFGRSRVAWVLSVFIKNFKAEMFFAEHENWAEEALETYGFPNEPPPFSFETNPALLNIFIKRFREAQSQKFTFQERVSTAKKRVRAQSSAPPQ